MQVRVPTVNWRGENLKLAREIINKIQVAVYAPNIKANAQWDAEGGGFAFVEQTSRAGTQPARSHRNGRAGASPRCGLHAKGFQNLVKPRAEKWYHRSGSGFQVCCHELQQYVTVRRDGSVPAGVHVIAQGVADEFARGWELVD